MPSFLAIVVAVVCLAATGAQAQDVTVPIQTYGDLGTANRPNWCLRPTDHEFVQGKSDYHKISDNQFE